MAGSAACSTVKAETEYNRGSKRQKVSANQSKLRANAAPYQPQMSDTNAFTRQDNFVPLSANNARFPYSYHRAPKPGNLTPIELKMVRSKLDRVAKEVTHCRSIMRQAYNRHSDQLKLDETIEDMRDLAKHLELAEENSQKGVEVLNHIRDVLERL